MLDPKAFDLTGGRSESRSVYHVEWWLIVYGVVMLALLALLGWAAWRLL